MAPNNSNEYQPLLALTSTSSVLSKQSKKLVYNPKSNIFLVSILRAKENIKNVLSL
jgi:hypothetical protein